ncbi:hypothetical protein KG112_03030 [Nocardioides sp. zg-ZUI104]|uniref:hypothetical protein n=1 Tax=Nocardioides faecalis TaxID=2803858 RepID=UPI001BCFB2AC|nr:hypothetical protein [Nocardioides faecalis]MBS4751782.1 hypothetical protein [Nocardioides faecalis]
MSEQPQGGGTNEVSPTADPNDDTGQSLAPRPKPKAEPQEPPPGGPHAVPGVGGEGAYSAEPRDLDPTRNPATDEIPAAALEGEDTETEATRGDSPDADPADESSA